MNQQLSEWKGRFGREYTRRNQVDWRTRVPGWAAILNQLEIVTSVLEVGCNRGHNLHAIQSIYPGTVVRGVEPMRFARRIAHHDGLDVRGGTVYDIPYQDSMFDLVFTCGVLIHVPPDKLQAAMRELVRVSGRYVLAVEYPAEQDQEITYRGRPDMLWKRDYGAHYQSADTLELVSTGDLGPGWDDARWWLLEKSSSDRSG